MTTYTVYAPRELQALTTNIVCPQFPLMGDINDDTSGDTSSQEQQ